VQPTPDAVDAVDDPLHLEVDRSRQLDGFQPAVDVVLLGIVHRVHSLSKDS
jgi:hypothetical protein